MFGGVELAQVSAEDGVDETGLGAEAAAFGLLDRFMDRSVIRDAVESEDLEQSQAQEALERGFLGAPIGLAGD